MQRKFLEDLGIEKEVIDKIMAENGKDIEAEKGKALGVNEQVKNLESQLEEVNKQIQAYKDMNVDEIKASASEWENKYNQILEDNQKIKNDSLLEKALSGSNTVDIDLLKKTINFDDLKFKDNEVIGLDNQLKELKESKPYLFKVDESKEDEKYKGYEPDPSNGEGKKSMDSLMDSIFN